MAVSVAVSADFSKLLSELSIFLARVRELFMQKVVAAYYRALQAIIRYNVQPSARGLPPNAKTGRMINSFRSKTNFNRGGSQARFYAVHYARYLRQPHGLDRPWSKFAWMRVRPQLQQFFREAVAEAQRGSA